MRNWLIKTLRGTPLESLAHEVDERLWQARGTARGSYSQHGEDRTVLSYFNSRRDGTYVDVGANYPIKISNTYLLYRHGWRGVTVEPIPRLFARHRRLRPRDTQVNVAVGPAGGEPLRFFEFDNSGLSTFDETRARDAERTGARVCREHRVAVRTLAEILDASPLAGHPIDFLSVDTEGFDLTVLSSNDWSRYRPKLISYEVPEDHAAAEGDRRIEQLLAAQGYRELTRAGCNVLVERVDA